jgi:hypothetical protein
MAECAIRLIAERHSHVEAPTGATDEQVMLDTAGPTDQVESCRSSPPSSLGKSPRDLDSSRGLPDLPCRKTDSEPLVRVYAD